MKKFKVLVFACLLMACSRSAEHARHTPPAPSGTVAAPIAPAIDAQSPAHFPGLHQVVAYGDGLFSGSVPEGDAGFETLAAMGVKTIISVDGAAPDVAAASARGLRYVHLPIGYNGMEESRRLEIARAIRDLPGPVYLHCHHGKHRSAAALGAAAVTLGKLTPQAAVARMKVSGTAPNYTGLYQCVSEARPATLAELLNADNAFPQVWKTTGMVQSMVGIDEAFEHLTKIEQAGWRTPADHPDLVPAAVAGEMADLLRNLDKDPSVIAKPAEHRLWMSAGADRAQELEDRLLVAPLQPATLTEKMESIRQSCTQCHRKYRD